MVPARHCLRRLQSLAGGYTINTYHMNFYYTYVLRCNDKKLYVGYTSNLKTRVVKHEKGLVPATKSRRPLELIYYEACGDEAKAITREKYLKSGFGRNFLKSRI